MTDGTRHEDEPVLELEQTLQEAHLRFLVEKLPAILWTTDKLLRFTSGYGTGLADLDLQPNQMVGVTLAEYFRTDDPEFLPIAMHRRALQGEAVSYQVEWAGRSYQSHLEPLHQPDGTITGVIGVALDVTASKQARAAHAQRETLLQTLVERAPVCIMIADRNAQIVMINPAVEEMLGYSAAELRELGIPGITHPEDYLADTELFSEVCTGRRDHYQVEKRFLHKDGQVIWGRMTVAASRGPQGQNQYFMSITEDITARKQAEEALQRTQENFQVLMKLLAADGTILPVGRVEAYEPRHVAEWAAEVGASASGEPDNQARWTLVRETTRFLERLGGTPPESAVGQAAGIGGRLLFHQSPRSDQDVDARLRQMELGLEQLARGLADAGLVKGAQPMLGNGALAELQKLSPREREILESLLANQRVPAIARRLYISQHTVRNHLKSIFHKLEVHSQAELLELLMR